MARVHGRGTARGYEWCAWAVCAMVRDAKPRTAVAGRTGGGVSFAGNDL